MGGSRPSRDSKRISLAILVTYEQLQEFPMEALPMASPVHFRLRGLSLREERGMKRTLAFAAISLALLLAGSVVLPPRVLAQDGASTDTAKRKVRSKVVPEYPPLAKQMN